MTTVDSHNYMKKGTQYCLPRLFMRRHILGRGGIGKSTSSCKYGCRAWDMVSRSARPFLWHLQTAPASLPSVYSKKKNQVINIDWLWAKKTQSCMEWLGSWSAMHSMNSPRLVREYYFQWHQWKSVSCIQISEQRRNYMASNEFTWEENRGNNRNSYYEQEHRSSWGWGSLSTRPEQEPGRRMD